MVTLFDCATVLNATMLLSKHRESRISELSVHGFAVMSMSPIFDRSIPEMSMFDGVNGSTPDPPPSPLVPPSDEVVVPFDEELQPEAVARTAARHESPPKRNARR